MPAIGGRPSQYVGNPVQIKFKIDDQYYNDIARYAREHSLSVPHYVAMMMSSHVNGIRMDTAKRAVEAGDDQR